MGASIRLLACTMPWSLPDEKGRALQQTVAIRRIRMERRCVLCLALNNQRHSLRTIMMPRHRLRRCALALAFVLGTVARADEPPLGSIVSTVQPPAWLLHGTVLTPLTPGISIADGDTL